ncbi:MAG: beta-ketoacyl-[acyl-carrier-protein] synthase family protein [Clostridia bacterium]|nr:beta-ketoacyl-[acyl-carrier-protein] synthase family protein [Clostridia bacterium]
MEKKVVITGIGVISPVGTGKKKFWNSLVNGVSGVAEIKSFDTSEFRVKIAGEIKDFDAEKYLSESQISKSGRAAQYTYAGTKMAIEDAGIELQKLKDKNVAVCMGTTMGEVQVVEEIDKKICSQKEEDIKPELYNQYMSNNITSFVMQELDLKGPQYLFTNACAAGNYAIGYASDLIKRGKADMAIAGGVDPFSRVAFTGFHRLLSLTPDICSPFDKNRKGLVVGEGAGILILEELESAKARGATIYAEVKGYGLGMDAHHMTSPHPEGEGAIASIWSALKSASLSVDEIDYISAHGTGTPANDKIESIAIRKVFEGAKKIPPVSSIKSMMGHAMGAASALEAAACCLMIQHQTIIPTINFETPDPDCIEDCVPNVARKQALNHVLSNAFAFGGNTSCLVLSKC